MNKTHVLHFSLPGQLRSNVSYPPLKLFNNLKNLFWIYKPTLQLSSPSSCLRTLTDGQHPRPLPQCTAEVWLSMDTCRACEQQLFPAGIPLRTSASTSGWGDTNWVQPHQASLGLFLPIPQHIHVSTMSRAPKCSKVAKLLPSASTAQGGLKAVLYMQCFPVLARMLVQQHDIK